MQPVGDHARTRPERQHGPGFLQPIVPCGIADRGVTSLARETGGPVDVEEVKAHMTRHLAELFEWQQVS